MKGQKPIMTQNMPAKARNNSELFANDPLTESYISRLTVPLIIYDQILSIAFVSPKFSALTGYKSADLIGQKPPYVFWPTAKVKSYSRTLPPHEPAGQPQAILTCDRKVIWVVTQRIPLNPTGSFGWVDIWTDVTTTIQKQEVLKTALKTSTHKFKNLFNAVPVPLSISTFPEIKIVEVNQQFQKSSGFKRQEIIGKKWQGERWELESPESGTLNAAKHKNRVIQKEMNLVSNTGKPQSVIFRSKKWRLDGRDFIISAGLDITERKNIEAALRESEAFKAGLLNQSPIPILVINPDSSIQYINPAMEKLTGFSKSELIGTKPPYPWWLKGIDYTEQINTLVPVANEIREFQNKKGEHFWVELRRRQIKENKQTKYLLTTLVDITERKNTLDALIESEAFSSELLETAPNPIIVTNLDSSVRYVNPAFEKLTGYTRTELKGVKLPYPWWPQNRIREYIVQDDIGKNQNTFIQEREFVNNQGKPYWVIVNIHPVRENGADKFFLSNWVDITERIKNEAVIKESEAFNASLLYDAPNPVVVFNLDRSIKYINPAMEELTGFSSQELLGSKPPYPWWPPQNIEEYLSAGEIHHNHETRHMERPAQKKNGDIIWVSINMRAVKEQGVTKHFIANWQNISKHKAMEERIIELYQQEKAHREELQEEAHSRGQFINVLAHELRTPVTPILASTAMLNDLFINQADDVKKKLILNVYKSTRTLAHRLEELLDLARYSRGTFKLRLQPTELQAFFKDSIDRFMPSFEQRQQHLVVEMPESLPVADVDPSRLEQVISNLLSNSSKFGQEKGNIRVRISYSNEVLRVEVKDDGIGISQDDQQRLFQPYHRTEQDRQQFTGLGLGLAVAKQIIEAHGGNIWVESEINKGSIFIFSIPLKLTKLQPVPLLNQL